MLCSCVRCFPHTRHYTPTSKKSWINPIYWARFASGVLCLFPVFKFRDRVLHLVFLPTNQQVQQQISTWSAEEAHKHRFEHFGFFFLLYGCSFALKFHLVLKAFLYVRSLIASPSSLCASTLCYAFRFVRLLAMTLTTLLRCHRTANAFTDTSLSARYKIRSSVFGGVTTPQNGVASHSPLPLPALLLFTFTNPSTQVDELATLAETA